MCGLGWVPQTFKSSRESRAEKQYLAAEDFMDEEVNGFPISTMLISPRILANLESLLEKFELKQNLWKLSQHQENPGYSHGKERHHLRI